MAAGRWLRLRQIALVAEQLAPVEDALADVLGVTVCYRDPGVAHFGLESALFPVGNQLLEVVAPTRPGAAGGRYLERRGGDGGYMVITQCDDQAPRARSRRPSPRARPAVESDPIDAAAAHGIGLVDRVTEPERLLDEACDQVRHLAATSPPAAIAETRRLVYRHLGTDYRTALAEAEASQNRFVTAPDAIEGATAFLEKRAPRFASGNG